MMQPYEQNKEEKTKVLCQPSSWARSLLENQKSLLLFPIAGMFFCKFWKMRVLNVYFSAEMLMQLVLWTFVCFFKLIQKKMFTKNVKDWVQVKCIF